MDTIYFDWSHNEITVLKNNGWKIYRYPNLFVMLDDLKVPTRIIGEATFESFFRETRRTEFIKRCEIEGHDLRTVPNRATGRWRDSFLKWKKTDDNDVKAIRKMVEGIPGHGPVHLAKPRVFNPDDPFISVREQANKHLMEMRNLEIKDAYALKLAESLPDPEMLTDVQQRLLCDYNRKKDRYTYNKVIVAAVGVAAEYVSTTREFDRLAGLYHHGYGCLIRSDLHFHGWWKRKGYRTTETFTDYRRELRWLYHHLRHIYENSGE